MNSQNSNQVLIDYKNSPELAELLAGKKPGDTCVWKVTLQLNEADQNGAKLLLKKVEYDDKKVEPASDKPVKMEIKDRSKPPTLSPKTGSQGLAYTPPVPA